MPELTNHDLKLFFYELVDNHFKNLPRPNSITIKFGKRAKRRLGSIWYDDKNHTSVITITKYLANPVIPLFVVKAVLAHELVHYYTGFGSSLDKKYEHAHRGSVIKREMSEYGLWGLYSESEKWIKQNWALVVRKNSRYNSTDLDIQRELMMLHQNIVNAQQQARLF